MFKVPIHNEIDQSIRLEKKKKLQLHYCTLLYLSC